MTFIHMALFSFQRRKAIVIFIFKYRELKPST